jgi:hypothetical protein
MTGADRGRREARREYAIVEASTFLEKREERQGDLGVILGEGFDQSTDRLVAAGSLALF